MKLLTPEYKTKMTNTYVDYMRNNVVYVFGAGFLPFENDQSPPSPQNSMKERYYQAQDEMIFAKRVKDTDVSVMIKRLEWVSGTVYDAYDYSIENHHEKKFYVVSEQGSKYSVFKCIDNNNNIPSTQKPFLSETSPTDELYKTADGYVWKYMFNVDESVFDRFATNEYVPYTADQAVSDNAVEGTIERIIVRDPGAGYSATTAGIIEQINVGGLQTKFYIQGAGATLSAYPGHYTGNGIYITTGPARGEIRKIVEDGFEGNYRYIIIEHAFTSLPNTTNEFEISPYVTVDGDGVGFLGRVRTNETTGGIEYVEVVERGSGYTYGDVVLSSNTETIGSEATALPDLEITLPPKGGHGFDAQNELFGHYAEVSVDFIADRLPSNGNEFRKFGIIDGMLFNEVQISTDSVSEFTIDQVITQEVTNVSGRITDIDADNFVLTLTEVDGVFESNNAIANSNTNVTDVLFDYNNIDLRTKLTISLIFESTFTKGEQIIQETTGASAYVHEIVGNEVYVVDMRGTFEVSEFLDVVGQTSDARAVINNVNNKGFVKGSGDILYTQNMLPVQRSSDRTERIKIVLGF